MRTVANRTVSRRLAGDTDATQPMRWNNDDRDLSKSKPRELTDETA